MNIQAKIIEVLPDNKYIAVDEYKNSYTAICVGNMRKNKIYVGDNIELQESSDVYVIKKINQRKNSLIRPPVANIDYMILCISLDMPSPDYLLLDKQIILCMKQNITPIICMTKVDLLNEENKKDYDYLKKVYEFLGFKVVYTSALTEEGLEKKFNFEKNKIYSFSGNSGVGKSTIIANLLNLKDNEIEIGNIAAKTNKGKHTTKYVKLYELNSGAYIIDTPGFSSYDLLNVEYKQLKNYYVEFNKFNCKYLDCNHVFEDESECVIKQNVKSKNIDLGRYERYTYLYKILKEKDNFKYKR